MITIDSSETQYFSFYDDLTKYQTENREIDGEWKGERRHHRYVASSTHSPNTILNYFHFVVGPCSRSGRERRRQPGGLRHPPHVLLFRCVWHVIRPIIQSEREESPLLFPCRYGRMNRKEITVYRWDSGEIKCTSVSSSSSRQQVFMVWIVLFFSFFLEMHNRNYVPFEFQTV